uniref:Uncharacterized protein n=1 Tax=Bracon brevicornis TaxID=1563983 RepID=A0A6V7KSL2_9HYME
MCTRVYTVSHENNEEKRAEDEKGVLVREENAWGNARALPMQRFVFFFFLVKEIWDVQPNVVELNISALFNYKFKGMRMKKKKENFRLCFDFQGYWGLM